MSLRRCSRCHCYHSAGDGVSGVCSSCRHARAGRTLEYRPETTVVLTWAQMPSQPVNLRLSVAKSREADRILNVHHVPQAVVVPLTRAAPVPVEVMMTVSVDGKPIAEVPIKRDDIRVERLTRYDLLTSDWLDSV